MAKAPFDVALEAWRKTRNPRFAAIVEAISAREPERELVGASGKKVDVAKWFALADAGDWRDLPRLIATIAAGNSPQALERVKKLAERDDPRLVKGLLALAAEPPYTAGTSRRFWQALVAALEASNDVRARDGMNDLSRRYKTINDTNMGAWVAGAMSKAAAKIEEPKPLDAKQEKTLNDLEVQFLGEAGATIPRKKAQAATAPEELFANIVDAPDDDDARLVYADLLSELGQTDRAELIVLQVERAAGRGTAARADLERTKFHLSNLLKEFGAPLSAAADKVYFERGFPHRVELAKTGLAHVADAVEWGTVRILEHVAHAPATAVRKFLDGGKAKNLFRVEALPPRWIDKLETPTFPWTHIALLAEHLRPAHLERFPRLTHLELVGDGVHGSLLAAAPGLESLEFDGVTESDGAHLFQDHPKLSRLVLGRNARAGAFAGLGVRELHVQSDGRTAGQWLRAMPTVRELHLQQREHDIRVLADLFDQHPALEKVGFTFAFGSPGAELVRRDGSLQLVGRPGPRWGRYFDELAESAKPLAGRVEKVILYPGAPRHEVDAAPDPRMAIVREAWKDKLELRELL